MKYFRTAFFLFSLLGTVSGCGAWHSGQENSRKAKIVFSEIAKGTGMETPTGTAKVLAVIRDDKQFKNVFSKMASAPAPEIDFRTHSVLLVQMGTCNSAGYSIEVADVLDHEYYIEVRVISREPGKSCINALALTRPYQFVKIPRTEKEIVFSESLIVTDCR